MGIKSTSVKTKIYEFSILIIDTLFSLLSILTSSLNASYYFNKVPKTPKKSGCCILGNAPSLQKSLIEDFEFIKENDILVVNFFSEYDYFFAIKPNYYLILDPLFFDEQSNSNNKVLNFIKKLNTVTWQMILFIPALHRNSMFKKAITNKNIQIVKYNANKVNGIPFVNNFLYKRNLGIPSSRNVIIPSTLLMINLEYSNIYLFGVEYSWLSKIRVDENNKHFWNDAHAFSHNNIRYLHKGEYKLWLNAVSSMLDAHEKLESYSEQRNCKIINKTKGSYIDAHSFK